MKKVFFNLQKQKIVFAPTGLPAEADFVFQHKSGIYPVEVKAEENLKAESLKVYSDKFTPAISVRTSMSDYRHDERLLNVPLYGISRIVAECEKFI